MYININIKYDSHSLLGTAQHTYEYMNMYIKLQLLYTSMKSSLIFRHYININIKYKQYIFIQRT